VLVIALCVVGFVVCVVLGYVNTFLEWVAGLGWWGNILMAIAFALMAFPFVFGYVVLGLGAGLLYNLWLGTATICIGSNIGACLSFFACRQFGRKWIEKKIENSPKLKAIFESIGDNGFKISFLIRFIPIPFGIQNAMLSVSSVPYWKFGLGTFMGLLPEQVAIVFVGKTLKEVNDVIHHKASFGTPEKVIFALDAVMIVVLSVVLFFIGRKALQKVSAKVEDTEDQVPLLDPASDASKESKESDVEDPTIEGGGRPVIAMYDSVLDHTPTTNKEHQV